MVAERIMMVERVWNLVPNDQISENLVAHAHKEQNHHCVPFAVSVTEEPE